MRDNFLWHAPRPRAPPEKHRRLATLPAARQVVQGVAQLHASSGGQVLGCAVGPICHSFSGTLQPRSNDSRLPPPARSKHGALEALAHAHLQRLPEELHHSFALIPRGHGGQAVLPSDCIRARAQLPAGLHGNPRCRVLELLLGHRQLRTRLGTTSWCQQLGLLLLDVDSSHHDGHWSSWPLGPARDVARTKHR